MCDISGVKIYRGLRALVTVDAHADGDIAMGRGDRGRMGERGVQARTC